MEEAVGVGVYLFYYELGYAICIPDPNLTVTTCAVTITHKHLPKDDAHT